MQVYVTVNVICIAWFEMSATRRERELQNEKFSPTAGLESTIFRSLDWRSNRLCCRDI